MKKILLKFCNTYFLVFSIILFAAVLTWIIPAGEYDRVEQAGRTIAVADSFHSVLQAPQGIGAVFKAPITGFVQCAEIIAFVFIVGAAFTIIERTGTINTLIKKISFFFAKKTASAHFLYSCVHFPVFAMRSDVWHGRRNTDFYSYFYSAGFVIRL